MKKRIQFFLASLLAISFLSCQSVRSVLQDPKVSIRSVDLEHISFNGVDMICRLDVENPNGFDVPFPELDWQVFINTAPFINGRIDEGAKIKGHKTVTLDLPFSMTYAGLFDTFASLWETREASYKIDLAMKFPLPILNEKTYYLDFSGIIPLLQIPKIQAGDFSIGKLDFTGIELDWGYTVENPNSFPIPFPKIDWEYAVNGIPLVSNNLDDKGEIAGLAKSSGAVQLSLRYADIFELIGSMVKTAEIPSLLKLDTSFPIPSLEKLDRIIEIPGTLPILQKPEMTFKGINIKNLALQKLDFVVSWEVENRNSFPMSIGQFDYDLTVNNASWARGIIESPPLLKPGAKTVIPLDITISSLSLVTQIVDIINRGVGVNYRSQGNFSLLADIPGLDLLDMDFDLSGVTRLTR